jgi:hypothetical protein
MRIISAPARAECELAHRFFSTVPSVKYSDCADQIAHPRSGPSHMVLTMQPRCFRAVGETDSDILSVAFT